MCHKYKAIITTMEKLLGWKLHIYKSQYEKSNELQIKYDKKFISSNNFLSMKYLILTQERETRFLITNRHLPRSIKLKIVKQSFFIHKETYFNQSKAENIKFPVIFFCTLLLREKALPKCVYSCSLTEIKRKRFNIIFVP